MCTSVCSEIVAHFGSISEKCCLLFPHNCSLLDGQIARLRTRISKASQYKKCAATIPSSKLSLKYFPTYIIIISLIMAIEYLNK